MSLFDEKVEISKATLIETKRMIRALDKDKNSYLYKIFSDDYAFYAIEEINHLYKETFKE